VTEAKSKHGRRNLHLTAAQRADVRRRRAAREGWQSIGKSYGVSAECIRRTVDVEYRERRNETFLNLSHARAAGIEPSVPAGTKVIVPESVLAERDRRLRAPVSFSAAILGDPPQGYSALDRMGR
jgi:hypothetical protein